jgi:hypothetical protein
MPSRNRTSRSGRASHTGADSQKETWKGPPISRFRKTSSASIASTGTSIMLDEMVADSMEAYGE